MLVYLGCKVLDAMLPSRQLTNSQRMLCEERFCDQGIECKRGCASQGEARKGSSQSQGSTLCGDSPDVELAGDGELTRESCYVGLGRGVGENGVRQGEKGDLVDYWRIEEARDEQRELAVKWARLM